LARRGALLRHEVAEAGSGAKSFHVDEAPEEGRFLMARDLARLLALEDQPALGPSLVVYRWAEPTISLGFLQRAERVLDREAVRAAGVPVVRRPTGGRAILHVDEWTYAACAPIDHPRLGGELKDSLGRLSGLVARALGAIGVAVEIVPERTPRATDEEAEEACFHRALGHELSVGGRKLAGSAQRRLARALLTQGTILAGGGHERLAEFLAGDEAAKARGRERLRAGSVTVRDVVGRTPDFEAFAAILWRAWEAEVDAVL